MGLQAFVYVLEFVVVGVVRVRKWVKVGVKGKSVGVYIYERIRVEQWGVGGCVWGVCVVYAEARGYKHEAREKEKEAHACKMKAREMSI
jgi:hypothetical protein